MRAIPNRSKPPVGARLAGDPVPIEATVGPRLTGGPVPIEATAGARLTGDPGWTFSNP